MDVPYPLRPAFKPPLTYGSLALPSRYLLSPLAGFTNWSFRRVVHELGGVGLTTTDLVNARGLLTGSPKTLSMIETCPAERPFAVQIFGGDAAILCDAARFLEARGVDSVDINMGCPVDRITRGGAGASMMCRADATIALARQVVEAVSIPVTVKMRLGWDSTQITAPKFAREFEQAGVAAVAIHGRTREQGFTGQVDRDGIRQVVEAVERIPIIGNGDIRTIADAARMLSETGCAGISVGRGALANPWIFRQLAAWEETGRYDPPGNFEQRLELLKQQFGYLEESRGTHSAIIMFRKTAHWYLKAMRVPSWLRNRFQVARTAAEIDAALRDINTCGPKGGDRTGILPDLVVPVPSGPVERW
ncbi:MAG TPA: tRNA dihydrouridine synthase DusB [Planctomycetaceae bacterium]|jgi:nifR3 family TIM-barrel protein|nr:tRNA dihydrouridine synthase DusB [Planctomycetaceae bacterium]